jgi:hypothetical protein
VKDLRSPSKHLEEVFTDAIRGETHA